MILRENVFPIGRLLKPHGIKGEITLLFDKETYADIDTPFYFLEIDGLFVPFFIEEIRFTTDLSAKVKFEDINDENVASRYVNSSVFLPREAIKNITDLHETSWNYFLGFSVFDNKIGFLGKIESVDDSTLNILFLVQNNDEKYLIPATEDFITEINEEQQIIRMTLPEGLIEKE